MTDRIMNWNYVSKTETQLHILSRPVCFNSFPSPGRRNWKKNSDIEYGHGIRSHIFTIFWLMHCLHFTSLIAILFRNIIYLSLNMHYVIFLSYILKWSSPNICTKYFCNIYRIMMFYFQDLFLFTYFSSHHTFYN